MGSFADQIKAFAEKANVSMETVVRKAVLDLQGGVVLRSPVDTGRFRSNWMVGIGAKNSDTVDTEDKSGQASLDRVNAGMVNWSAGQAIYLTNSLPYAQRLEYGWSDQAPNGIVRLTVQAWRDYVAKAVAEVK